MKKLNRIFIALLLSAGLIISCSESEEIIQNDFPVPTEFSVDIPSSISEPSDETAGRISEDEFIKGEDLYQSLRGFINVGEQSAEILEEGALLLGNLLKAQNISSVTFLGADGRSKVLEIQENVSRGGAQYDYEMTMIDEQSDSMAFQLLWNQNPVSCIGIVKPYYINQTENLHIDLISRIDYHEDDPNYDETMLVYIAGLETSENGDIDNLKMFVGKKGDIVEVIGNSNHPDFILLDPDFTGGRNYAFVGRGSEASNIGVVNLWLPPSGVSTDDFEKDDEYSVYNVLETEIEAVANLDEVTIEEILAEALSPAYFDSNGYLDSGEDNKPVDFSDSFVNLTGMFPFVPVEVRDLEIRFLE